MFAADTTNGSAIAGAGASSHDYLEKIFQIPYWVRPIEPGAARRYVSSISAADIRQEERYQGAQGGERLVATDQGETPPSSSPGGSREAVGATAQEQRIHARPRKANNVTHSPLFMKTAANTGPSPVLTDPVFILRLKR